MMARAGLNRPLAISVASNRTSLGYSYSFTVNYRVLTESGMSRHIATAATLAAIIAAGCGRVQTPPHSSTQSIDDDLAVLEDAYHSVRATHTTNDPKFVELSLVRGIIEQKYGDDFVSLHSVAYHLITKTSGQSPDEFLEAVYCDIVEILAAGGERDRLVDLISRKCPHFLRVQMPLEFLLAALGGEHSSRLSESNLVLFDAYERAEDAKAREAILSCLHPAFTGIPRDLSNDAFVAKCRKWYVSHADRIVPNPFYSADGEPLFYAAESVEKATEARNSDHEFDFGRLESPN